MPLWVVAFAFTFTISSRLSFVAPFAYHKGITRVGWYFALYSGIAVALRLFGGNVLDRLGVEPVMRQSLERVAGPGFAHVSLDMDALDPDIAPGVGTPVRGGLSYREAHLAFELVAESGLAGSLEVVEVNPILDRENETAELAVELVASALGARIL